MNEKGRYTFTILSACQCLALNNKKTW